MMPGKGNDRQTTGWDGHHHRADYNRSTFTRCSCGSLRGCNRRRNDTRSGDNDNHTKSLVIIPNHFIVLSFICLILAGAVPQTCSGFSKYSRRGLSFSSDTDKVGRLCCSRSHLMMTPLEKRVFGTIDDEQVHQFIITNRNGVRATVMEYGAILTSLETHDAAGEISDLTHGFETLDEWITLNSHYFGSTIGRFGNRIANGKFNIGESSYKLALNNIPNGVPCSLHGGSKGFDKVLWKGSIIDDQTVEFSYLSKDGEEGYPGNVEAKVTYSLNDKNELKWEATATTDAPTIINMVHHTYWNLCGDPTQTILDHLLQINANHYLPTNEGLIPKGEIASVENTPMDFTQRRVIGERIDDDFEALKLGGGYDHCWVIRQNSDEDGDNKVQLVARVEDPKSKRIMEVLTDQPGLQFYTSNFLDGSVIGKNRVAYPKRSALCLETQRFPDSPNHSNFPSCMLSPGETYKHTLIFKFSTCINNKEEK